ncbi:sulfite exporter TauE/SafE family protein [Candidatus Nomurabacteria bacterium]|nr:sulfite exporter TauE/SafE family protein [Candidatus Nomurabacteria bacterium]
MIDVTFITAFTAGLLTFFAPCTFVALPTFLAYITNNATMEDPDSGGRRFRVMRSTLLYAVGFILVFTLLGYSASSISRSLNLNKDLLTQIGGVLIILLGSFVLFGEKIKGLQFLFREKKIGVDKLSRFAGSSIYPFILGFVTAIAWTPCVGPILGGILLLAGTQSDTPAQGAFLLTIHGIGIMVPFLVIALLFDRASGIVKKYAKYTKKIHTISGYLLLIIGLLMLTGNMGKFTQIVFRLHSMF